MSKTGIAASILGFGVAAVAGCQPGEGERTPTEAITSSTPKSIDDKPSAETAPTLVPVPSASPVAPPTNQLASLFSQPSAKDVEFVRKAKIAVSHGSAVTIRVAKGWEPVELNDMLNLFSKHQHAFIWASVMGKNATYNKNDLRLKCQRINATGCVWAEPLRGTFGEPPIEGEIRTGSCKRYGKPAECYWLRGTFTKDRDVVVFASLRKDVYPKREAELLNTLRTVAIAPQQ